MTDHLGEMLVWPVHRSGLLLGISLLPLLAATEEELQAETTMIEGTIAIDARTMTVRVAETGLESESVIGKEQEGVIAVTTAVEIRLTIPTTNGEEAARVVAEM
jgi:hypothetical protein